MFKANFIKEAATIVKGEDTDKYIKLANKAIDIYTMGGRSSSAAALSKDVAEKLEEDCDLE
jgi:hypothetical protein